MKDYRIALTEILRFASGEWGKACMGGGESLPGIPALYGSSSVSSSLLERLTIRCELFFVLSDISCMLYGIRKYRHKWLAIFSQVKMAFTPGMDAIPPKAASHNLDLNF